MENKKWKSEPIALDDAALEGVSGGLEVHIVGRRQVTTCDDFVCCWCGRKKADPWEKEHVCHKQGDMIYANICNECEYLFSCSRANQYEGIGSPV